MDEREEAAEAAGQRRTRAREEARLRVLAAASRLFEAEGEEGLSMRRVAQTVGCSAGALYLLFRDRAALLDAMLVASRDELRTALGAAAAHAARSERAALAARVFVRWALAHPTHYELLFVRRPTNAAGGPASAAQARVADHDVLWPLDDALSDAFGHKRRRERSAARAAQAALHGLVQRALRYRGDDGDERGAAATSCEDDAALVIDALLREVRR